MGNSLACVLPHHERMKRASKPPSFPRSTSKKSSFLSAFSSSKKKEKLEDEAIKEQAIAAALLYQEYQRKGYVNVPFNRSASAGYFSSGSKKRSFPRSTSSRPRTRSDPLLQPRQLVRQDSRVDGLETNRIVLVHGGGFGAWCWYKTMTLLREDGFIVDAIHLMGSGVDSLDTNNITSVAQYAKPLLDILENLGNDEKVILVGHDLGGVCITFAMELFPSKVAKAIFIAAVMLTNGQSALDVFSQQMASNDLMREAHIFLHGNGQDQPPTAIDFDQSLLKDLLFNQSPAKDIALASVSIRPIPFAPILEKLSLSEENFGSIPRFYIKTLNDFAITLLAQEAMVNSNPPKQVFELKGSDHAPFFSKPRALHRILLEIARTQVQQGSSSHP